MAKYYPDIAKGAKGKTENSFFRSSQIKRARRSMLDLISLFCSRHISLTTQCAMLSTDLLTGSLTYENKFSLDAKPIEGGVRVVVVVVIAFESDSFSLPTPTNFAYSTKERDRKSFQKKKKKKPSNEKGERETNL